MQTRRQDSYFQCEFPCCVRVGVLLTMYVQGVSARAERFADISSVPLRMNTCRLVELAANRSFAGLNEDRPRVCSSSILIPFLSTSTDASEGVAGWTQSSCRVRANLLISLLLSPRNGSARVYNSTEPTLLPGHWKETHAAAQLGSDHLLWHERSDLMAMRGSYRVK
jgi:hypothetical protein